MADNTNEADFRRLMDEGFNQGRLNVVDELVSPAFEEHQPRGPGLPVRGQDAVKAVIQSLRASFPDIHYAIDDLAVDGDQVWARLKATATQAGPFMGHEPTGRSMAIDVIDITRFEDGRMVEHWGVPDRLGAMLQLGLVPGPSGARGG
jgi:predicted ester cyclase